MLRISIAKNFWICLYKLEIIDEQGDQMGISEKLVTDDKIAARRIFNSLLVFGRVAEHGLSCLI